MRVEWTDIMRHRPCIHPCSGTPVVRHGESKVWVAASGMPEWLQCSECGHSPLPEEQHELLKAYGKRMAEIMHRVQEAVDRRHPRGHWSVTVWITETTATSISVWASTAMRAKLYIKQALKDGAVIYHRVGTATRVW